MSESTGTWSGGLYARKKGDLADLAGQLGLDLDDKEMTRLAMLEMLKTHLASNEAKLKGDPRFKGLYGQRGRRRASSPNRDEEEDSSPPPGEPTTPSPTKTPRRSSVREVTPPTTPAAARSPPQAQTRDASATGDSFLQTPAKVVSDALTQFPPQVEGAVANVSQQAGVLSVYTSRAYDKTRKFLSSSPNIATLFTITQMLVLLYSYIPWNYKQISYKSSKTSQPNTLSIPYAPVEAFLSLDIYWILLKFALQSTLVPLISGKLVSFNRQSSSSLYSFDTDPVSAGIVRLAAAVSSDFGVPQTLVSSKTRIISASTALAFAVVELIAKGTGTREGESEHGGTMIRHYSPPVTRSQIEGAPRRKAIVAP